MKFLLYVAVTVFVLSVDCAVLRRAANGIDKPNSSNDYHSSGCEPSPENEELEEDISQSDAKNLLSGLPADVAEKNAEPAAGVKLDQSENADLNSKFEKRDIGDLFPVGGNIVNQLANTARNVLSDMIPHFGKRDLAGLLPPDVVKSLVSKREQFEEDVSANLGKRDIGNLFPIGGSLISDLVHKAEDMMGQLVPKLRKRDIASLIPLFGRFISDFINQSQDLAGLFIPKFGKRDLSGSSLQPGITDNMVNKAKDAELKLRKRDIGLLFPMGGKAISRLVNKGEDVIGAFIPKFGKRDIGSLFPMGGETISRWVHAGEDAIGAYIPKLGKRDIGNLFPIGGEAISDMVHNAEDTVGTFIPKFGKRDIGSLFPMGGSIVSDAVNKVEDLVGLIVPHFGKRDLEPSLRQERGLLMDAVQTANADLLKPTLQGGANMGERFGKLLLTPFV